MSDRMTPISFEKLLNWILDEYKTNGTIFGINNDKFYKNTNKSYIDMFGEQISTCIGPAAGPHSQLTQNIVASYLTGSRFIELKTVQTLDGEDLPVSKPCIFAEDEGYNVEWSTELRVQDAFNEYIKAWFLLHVLMRELDLSSSRDFMFNMSVGYDLEGIKSTKIDNFINGMIDASSTDIWNECINVIENNKISLHLGEEITKLGKDEIVIWTGPIDECPEIDMKLNWFGTKFERFEDDKDYLTAVYNYNIEETMSVLEIL